LNLVYVVPGSESWLPVIRLVTGQGILVAIAFFVISYLLVMAEIEEERTRGAGVAGYPAEGTEKRGFVGKDNEPPAAAGRDSRGSLNGA
jgi:hypothetical protein